MPSDDSRYWFPAKRYGWGWGVPVAWQGWAVIAGYFVLFAAGAFLLPSQASMPAFFGFMGYAIVLTIALTAICWWKGEPPKWRWGDDR